MNEKTVPDFDELADVLAAAGGLASPAELQGQLCGQLAAGQQLDCASWLGGLTAQCDLQRDLSAEEQACLAQIYSYSTQALAGSDFAWELVLPEEDSPLDMRVEQLAAWCEAFLVGVGLVREHAPGPEFHELLEDFAAIAQVGTEDDAEGAEQSLFELSEYVRLGALNAFLLTHANAPAESLHTEPTTAATPADLFRRKLH